eukprot:TCONS_00007245-protein
MESKTAVRTQSLKRGQLHPNTPLEENPLSIEYFGNMLIRKQYYGLIERPNTSTDEENNPLARKQSRFRVEPSNGVSDDDNNQLIVRSPSLAKLENPEFQTRWYFKFFLGTVHNNYAFLDNTKEPRALSVCLTDAENHGIQQYRAILWQKSGCRRICFPSIPNKTFNPREVLSYFGMEKIEKHPREIIAPEVQKELLVLEEQEGSVNFKFGVIYAKKGQRTDDEMFGNVKGSDEFVRFLNVLGDTIDLKGWTGYRGGLDVKDNMTGVHSVYTMYEGHEVMFHVSVMLPYSKDTQQVERKRHIGNDIAVIVFVDGEPDEELSFKPSSVRTKFTHVFAVIRYSKRTQSYYLTVFTEENVPAYGPPIPLPAKFTNPQEFRSFLITKLMNGEKAAYVSPVFSNKRQRTLESLISGLQNDQWLKPEKFGLKRAVSHAVTNRENKRAFLELGQTLKVNKIMQGAAPTSVNNVGGLLALKNTPWEPHAVLSNLNRPIICGDNIGNKLLVSCDVGIYLVSEHGARLVFDRSMTACQLSVVEDYGFIMVRIRKHGRIYVLPLSLLTEDRQVPFCRRDCAQFYLKKSKGSHLFSHSRQESPYLVVAIAVGKRLSIYKWAQNGFKKHTDFVVTETPITLTIIHDAKDKLLLCVGLRHRFDIVNVQTKQVTLLKNIVTYRKPKIVSALDIFDEDNPELLLTYSHSSVFVRLRDNITEIVSFFWNNAPKDIVCAFPYILGFSENSIEIRLMVNGNLVHTHCVPHMKLITAKNDIYFTSSLFSSTPTTIRRRSNAQQIGQTFMKIGLSDLAGLNRIQEETVDDIHEIMLRRNIGVSDHHYASNRSLNKLNKLKGANQSDTGPLHVRAYSASGAFCSPVINVRHNKVDITPVHEVNTPPRQSTVDARKQTPSQPTSLESRKSPPTFKPNRTQISPEPQRVPDPDTHPDTSPTTRKSAPAVAPKPTKRIVKSHSSASMEVNRNELKNLYCKQTTVQVLRKDEEERASSLPTSPNKVIFMPKQDMFYSPSQKGARDAKKRSSLNRSNQHLEQVGARHLRNSASIRSLPEASNEQLPHGAPREERQPRVNSTTYETHFGATNSNTWDVALTKHKPLTRHKSTMV